MHIGNIPVRNLIDLIKKIKETSGSGTNIKIFIESKEGYNGFKMIKIGKNEEKFEILEMTKSSIDFKLIKEKILKESYFFKEK